MALKFNREDREDREDARRNRPTLIIFFKIYCVKGLYLVKLILKI